MLKIFLAEDEFVIRNGIRNSINWEENGYKFVGDASDGELAWPLIQKERPDIVITDIRMPFMDGLELTKLIKKDFPQTEIIVLTGYEEFDYAREAVNIGVSKYLLKPINSRDLLREINDLSEKIEENRIIDRLRTRYQADMEEKEASDKRRLFRSLVTGSKSVSSLLTEAKELSINLSAMWYNIVLCIAWSLKHSPDEFSRSVIKIEDEMNRLQKMDPEHCLIFDRAPEGKALLFKAASQDELENVQTDYLNQLTMFLGNYKNIRFFGGIGQRVNRLSDMSLSFEKASYAIAHRFMYSENQIFDSSYLANENITRKVDKSENIDISAITPRQVDREKIIEFLKHGDKEEAAYFEEEFFSELPVTALGSAVFRSYIVLEFWFTVSEFVKENLGTPCAENGVSVMPKSGETSPAPINANSSGTNIMKTDDMAILEAPKPEDLRDENSARAYVLDVLVNAIIFRERSAKGHYTEVIEQAVHFIKKNYSNADLSLNQLAQAVNVSPNHLSTLFSQQTGSTFIHYLTDLRMIQAKELLRKTDKKTSVIGNEVGYQDPHYFSYLFRKTVGVPPTQYRQNENYS